MIVLKTARIPSTLVILFAIQLDVYALKNVTVTLEPPVVAVKGSCTLKCTYDLENAPLYEVKWYIGQSEFLRYNPHDIPNTKVFLVPKVNIDLSEYSDGTQVILRSVDFSVSPTFTCDVTTLIDFATGRDSKILKVIQLREESPVIAVHNELLHYGEILTAGCWAPLSRPDAILTFSLNNQTVATSDPVKTMDYLALNVAISEDLYRNKELSLRCEARVLDVFKNYTEVKLNITRELVPGKSVPAPKKVVLTLLPEIVQVAHTCILKCTYNVKDKSAYSVRWYHGNQEFYRYHPNSKQPRIFLATGLNIDEDRSNSSQVVVRGIDFNSAGSFSCEVTTDSGFTSAHDTKVMTVVESIKAIPTMNITMWASRFGEKVTANCLSPRSKPPVRLRFTLNNNTIADFHTTEKTSEEYSSSELVLNDVLPETQLKPDLVLRCETYIKDTIYSTHVERKINI